MWVRWLACCTMTRLGWRNVTVMNEVVIYERPMGTFQLHEFPIPSSWIPDFNFMNSRFQLHEFTISTSWIQDFNFMNSRFQLHEFTMSTSWIHNFIFMNSRFQLHEFTKLSTIIHNFIFTNSTSWSWNREFIKLKSWITSVENGNSRS
jgi:hypothetical protein